jgi:LPS export ABC transporter protein LptC
MILLNWDYKEDRKMVSTRNQYLNLPLIILVLGIGFILSNCEEQEKPDIDYTIEDEDLPAQESWNAQIYFTEKGELKAILYANHIRIYNDPKEKLIDTMLVDFMNKHGEVTSSLSSRQGKIDDVTEDMYAIDSVVVINDSAGTKLETEELMWRKKDEKIVTDKFVTITTEDEIIQGYGLESDQSFENYTIFDVTYQKFRKDK